VACLDSIAAQTYASVEHVVVDGGSTDGTAELLEQRGVRFVSERDRGQADALNKGFALARGEILTWLNADDVLAPDAVRLAVEAFEADPTVGLVYGDCTVRWPGNERRWRPRARIDATTFEIGNPIPQQGTFFTRSALERAGPLDEALHLAMDYDLWLRMLAAGVKAAYVPEVLGVFEIHDESKTGTAAPSAFFREEATSLLRTGRRRAAAVALGRAAAADAREDDGSVPSPALAAAIDAAEREADALGLADEHAALASAAHAGAAVLELASTPRGARHLARLDPWRYPETRRMLAASARRELRRRLSGSPLQPPTSPARPGAGS
jgi:Glycosyl transferase family 2